MRGGRGARSGGGRGGGNRRGVFTKLVKDKNAEMRSIHQAIRFLEGMDTYDSKAELLGVLQNNQDNGMARVRDMLSFINSAQDVETLLIGFLRHVFTEETSRPNYRPLRDNMLIAIYKVPVLLENLVARNVMNALSQSSAELLCSFLRAVTKPFIEPRSSDAVRTLARALRDRGDVDEARILCIFLLLDETEEGVKTAQLQREAVDNQPKEIACWVTDRNPPGGRHDNDHLNYRDIRIVPTVEELSCTIKPYLPLASGENNFIDDPVAALLDRNFRLLREDAISSMRSSLAEAETRCWKNARIIDIKVFKSPFSVAFVVQCDNRAGGKPDWNRSRMLMHGSVIALCREGRPVRMGTVVHREHEIKGEWLNCPTGPQIGVSFEMGAEFNEAVIDMTKNCGLNERYCELIAESEKFSKNDPHYSALEEQIEMIRDHLETFDLVEVSKSFFSYVPVLKTLQQMDDIPFAEELVAHSSTIAPSKPEYLPDIVSMPQKDFGGYHCNLNRWDTRDIVDHTSLDTSQAEALRHSLTSPVVLTQGPPGTGKTFLGALVARVIRENTDASILCVCYTNHALDQFLEHMMDAGEKSIVRIGGRSKSEMISKYQLKALARKENRGDSYSKRRVKQVHAQLFKLKEEIESIIEVFKSPLDWTQPSGGVQEYLEMEDPHILSFLSTPKATHDGFHIIGPNNKKLAAGDLWKCWRSGERFPEWLLPHMRLDVETFDEFTNFWLTPRDERIARIETWRQGVLSAITYDLADLIQQFNQLASENRVLCHEMELEVLRSARIIGATTSGAAANHDLLSSKAADVVIVEEAGEVLESHILTALSGGRDGRGASKHLILIGDHKQLPPKVENYELTTASGFGYNLDCSLFERMIHAGSPSVALEVQHRMRPCVSSLIRAQTYPSLRDHDSVFKYDDVRGVNDNLVFIDHDYKEDGADADNSTTKSNDYEAKFCLEIVRYLLLQGYRSDQIVVLTPYLGQLLKILSMMKSKLKDVSALVSERDLDDMEDLDPEEAKQAKSEQSKEQATKKIIRCSSIDNYQGEEADIVVISLVRSNKGGNIGFLKEPQRVNVLLSRARHGMFLVGNSATLKTSKKGRHIWEPLLELISQVGCVSKGFSTTCQLHPNDGPIDLCSPEDFRELRPNGGCQRPCDYRMSCGHTCPLRCHPTDRAHEIAQRSCCEPCRRFPSGCDRHPCPKLCKDECGPCKAQVGPVTLTCGHVAQDARCHQVSSDEALAKFSKKCQEKVMFQFEPCGHRMSTTCENSRSARPKCPGKCGALGSCQHSCENSCGSCDGNHDCRQRCSRTLFCGHVCDRPCHEPNYCQPCKRPCAAKCSHSICPKKCSKPCAPCVEACDWACPHEGRCSLVCSAPCARLPCNQRCDKKLSCGHRCPSICGEDCPSQNYCHECGSDRYKSQVVDMFTLTSYEEHDVDADPVLFLPCGHFFAASTLDGHIEIRKVYEMNEYGDFTAIKSLQGNDVSEKAKQCPDCRAVIHSVRRYNRLLRLVELRCLERKHMGTANEALKVLQERLKGSASDDQVIAPLNQLEQSIRKSPMRIVYEACQGRTALDSDPPSGPLIRCLELKGMYYGQRTKQYKDRHYQDARKAYQSGISIADTSSSRQSGARLRLSLAKLTVRCCVDVEEIRNRVNKLLNWILKESQIEASNPLFVDAQKLTNELSRMSRLDKIKEVMKAMTKDLASGYDYGTSAASHWYECPNGHPYFIGECGGAMQESTCPECGARVGGRSHQSAEGNRHVSGMFRDALSYL